MTPLNNHSDIEIIVIDDPWAKFGTPLPDHPVRASAEPTFFVFRRLRVWSIAALFTITLHLLLIGPLLLGTPSRKAQPPLTEGAAASQRNVDASEFVSTLIVVNDHSITDPDTHDDSAYDVMQAVTEKAAQDIQSVAELASVSQPELSGVEDSKEEKVSPIEATGDDSGRAQLFGLYLGQIKARIERAWEYPTTPIKGKFQCKVEIAQGEHGDVKEVTLQRCNANAAWQLSLVQAIQRASPLPAPPSPKVFTSVLTLNFEAEVAAHLANATSN